MGENGTTVTESDDESNARKHTLALSLAHIEWHGINLNLINTPGFANLLTNARAARLVVEPPRWR
jgi:elongation factor G